MGASMASLRFHPESGGASQAPIFNGADRLVIEKSPVGAGVFRDGLVPRDEPPKLGGDGAVIDPKFPSGGVAVTAATLFARLEHSPQENGTAGLEVGCDHPPDHRLSGGPVALHERADACEG